MTQAEAALMITIRSILRGEVTPLSPQSGVWLEVCWSQARGPTAASFS